MQVFLDGILQAACTTYHQRLRITVWPMSVPLSDFYDQVLHASNG